MAGLPEDYKQIKTLGSLLEINYKIISAKEQLRQNLISKMVKIFCSISKFLKIISLDFSTPIQQYPYKPSYKLNKK